MNVLCVVTSEPRSLPLLASRRFLVIMYRNGGLTHRSHLWSEFAVGERCEAGVGDKVDYQISRPIKI